MDEDRNQEPGKRMRDIFSSSNDDATAQYKPKSEPESEPGSKPQSRSILDQLPKMKPAEVEQEEAPPQPGPSVSSAALNELPQEEQPEQPLLLGVRRRRLSDLGRRREDVLPGRPAVRPEVQPPGEPALQ